MEKKMTPAQAADLIVKEIKDYAKKSPRNLMPYEEDYPIFNEPLIGFADGDDPLYTQYKKLIFPGHLTPREALMKSYNKKAEELPSRISVISWILPINENTRKFNREETKIPTRLWSHTRWYGEFFNEALMKHMVELLWGMGHLVAAPSIESYFQRISTGEKAPYSNWSERHTAYAAGLGTFSLSDGFISERGIAHRCGSVITDMVLPVTKRKAKTPYDNCLFYADGSCKACIARCPAGAISEKGHDKQKCNAYQRQEIVYLLQKYQVGVQGCGLCQTKVPCEDRNPVKG